MERTGVSGKNKDADALSFTPKEALKRVHEFGDLFKPVLKQVQRFPPELRDDRKKLLQGLLAVLPQRHEVKRRMDHQAILRCKESK